MKEQERQQQILELLKIKENVSVIKLINALEVSPATIRRDLTKMEAKGLIKRVHGGAILFVSNNAETSLILREEENKKEKKELCERAVDFIQNNQSVFLDSSSTVAHIVPFLNNFQYLVLVTNGLNIALQIGSQTKFMAFVPSGFVKTQSNSITGETVISSLSKIKCDVIIFSCAGISNEFDICEPSIEVSEIKNLMMKNAKRILLVDSTKFNKNYFSKTCQLKDVDVLITEKMPEEKYIQYLKENNVQLVVTRKS